MLWAETHGHLAVGGAPLVALTEHTRYNNNNNII
jgi:hypothetical protein